MAIDKPRNNLYKIPHLSTMSYEDIKRFEKDGVTPRNPNKIEEAEDEQQYESAKGAGDDQLG